MKVFVNALELAGFASIVAGLFMLAPWSAFVAGGALLIVFAFGLEREERK